MTDHDADLALLPELIDHSFGTGPSELPSPAERLMTGRRALHRRRRRAVALSVVAVVAVVGAGVALAGPGGDHATDAPIPALATAGTMAPQASDSPSETIGEDVLAEELAEKASRAEREAQRSMTDTVPATYDALGNVVVKDGWRIVRQVDEPVGLQPPQESTGLVLTDGDQTRWVLLTREQALDAAGNPVPDAFSSSGSSDPAGKGYSRFEDWLASMVELQGGPRTPSLVVVRADDVLRAGPAATVVEVRPAPVIDGYTAPGDRMAEVRRDGRTWFVMVRGHGADAELIPVDADVLPEPTFAAFVDHVRNQAGSGEGVR